MKAGMNKEELFLYFTWSTGISSSVVYKGEIIRGCGFAGEIGLAYLNAGKERLEKTASGPAISKLSSKMAGIEMTAKEVVERYKNQDSQAISIVDQVIEQMARGLYSMMCILDPHKTVLGGGVITSNPFLLELIANKLKTMAIPEQLHAIERIKVSTLKGEAGLIGAGMKCWEYVTGESFNRTAIGSQKDDA